MLRRKPCEEYCIWYYRGNVGLGYFRGTHRIQTPNGEGREGYEDELHLVILHRYPGNQVDHTGRHLHKFPNCSLPTERTK